MARPTLIIFARYPQPGAVKTRLIPALGAAGAARLQDQMTAQVLKQAITLAAARPVDVEVRFTGGDVESMRARYGGAFRYVPQGDGDLGTRLARAAGDATDAGSPFVIIGSDCPGVSADVLMRAFQMLAEHPLVLGPAADGGYYLIGMRRILPALFQSIAWSTPHVLLQARTAAKKAGVAPFELEILRDVDEPADVLTYPSLTQATPLLHPPERLALTGATGTLGGHFLAYTLETNPNLRVAALIRPESRRPRRVALGRILKRYADRITWIEGDLQSLHRLSPQQRRQLCETDGGLWHFAASTILQSTNKSLETHNWKVNDTGTSNLLDVVRQSDHPGPFFHLSTAYVCGQARGRVSEYELSADRGFRNSYEASKCAAEVRVRRMLDQGLKGSIFRPSLVIAHGAALTSGHVAGLLCRALKAARSGGAVTLRMPRTTGINAVEIDWVVRTLWEGARFHQSRRTYHLTAPSNVTIDAVADLAADSSGVCRLRLAPDAPVDSFSASDRLFHRMLAPFRPYFDAAVVFDDLNRQLDMPEPVQKGFNLRDFLLHELDHASHSRADGVVAAGGVAMKGAGL